MLFPFFLDVGIYLMKILNSLSNIFLLKKISICIGISGTFFNLIYNILQNNLEKEENQYDKINMLYKLYNLFRTYEIKSEFGYSFIIRIIWHFFIII